MNNFTCFVVFVLAPMTALFVIFSPCDGSDFGHGGRYVQCGDHCYFFVSRIKRASDLGLHCRQENPGLVPAVPRESVEYDCIESLARSQNSHGVWMGVCQYYSTTLAADGKKFNVKGNGRSIRAVPFQSETLVHLFYKPRKAQFYFTGVGLQGTGLPADGVCQMASSKTIKDLDELVRSGTTYCWDSLLNIIQN